MATASPQQRSQARVTKIVKKQKPNAGTLFTKENHKWMIIGGAVMILGFILMAGGKSVDPTQFKQEEVYSTMRITIAPILLLVGLGILVYAIMKKGNTPSNTTPTT